MAASADQTDPNNDNQDLQSYLMNRKNPTTTPPTSGTFGGSQPPVPQYTTPPDTNSGDSGNIAQIGSADAPKPPVQTGSWESGPMKFDGTDNSGTFDTSGSNFNGGVSGYGAPGMPAPPITNADGTPAKDSGTPQITPVSQVDSPWQFTGWSTQNHIGETPNVTTPKYAVQQVLANVDPNSAWAPDAAAKLNKMFNTTEFQAKDGETLLYGDEYVHSAPKDYGTTAYRGDGSGPKAGYFWGSTSDNGGGGSRASGAAAVPTTAAPGLSGGPSVAPSTTPTVTLPPVVPGVTGPPTVAPDPTQAYHSGTEPGSTPTPTPVTTAGATGAGGTTTPGSAPLGAAAAGGTPTSGAPSLLGAASASAPSAGGGPTVAPSATGSGSSGGSSASGGSLGTGLSNESQAGSLYDMLMQRAGQSLNVDAKDPTIANQVNAYGAQQTRAERDYLAQQAESAGPTGNIGLEQRMASEKAGQAVGGFQAQLIQQEINARRTEIQNALSGAQGLLTAEQQLSLQKELAQLSNAYNYAALAQNDSQFNKNLGQRAYEFDSTDEFRRSPVAP